MSRREPRSFPHLPAVALATAAMLVTVTDPAAPPTRRDAPTSVAPRGGRWAVRNAAGGRLAGAEARAALREIVLSPAELESMSTSHEGLEEEVLPDGTVLLHLRGRFHSGAYATRDADDRVTRRAGGVRGPVADERSSSGEVGHEP